MASYVLTNERAAMAPQQGLMLSSGRRRSRQKTRWSLWLLPAVALTALFTLYPALSSVRISAYDWPGYGPMKYIGFGNYRALLQDSVFRHALWNTVSFAIVTAVGTVAVGTALALAINARLPLTGFLKSVIFLPVMLPVVFTSLVWVYGLDPETGWVDNLLNSIHPGLGPLWLSSPNLVMWTIELITILQFAGLPMIIVLASLTDIPQEINEAAALDGASALRRIWHVSLPMAKDVILTILLLQLMYGFKVFDQVFVMTSGGPGTASQVMSTYAFNQAFNLQHFGLGAAAAVITCIVVAVLSMAYISVFQGRRISRA